MKKVFANWKMSLSALLLMGGLMLLSNSAQAQGSSITNDASASDVKGAGAWVLESDALALLQAQLAGPIEQALINLPNGGQQYIVWKNKAMLYEEVYAAIQNGVPVSKSVKLSYSKFAGPVDNLQFSALSPAEWQALLNELVDLLSN